MLFAKGLILITQKEKKHNALIDCHLLREVYINLVDQKEPKLNLENAEILDLQFKDNLIKKNNNSRKIVKPSSDGIRAS